MSELQPVGISFDDSEVGQEVVEAPEKPEAPEVEQESTEDQETGSASAADETAKEQAVKFDEKQQEKVNELIAEKVKKQREAERKAEKLEKELAEVRAKLPEQTRPEIPPIPDPFSLSDAEFKAQMVKREEAIRRQAAYDAEQTALQRQAASARQEAENAKAEATQRKVQSYSQRAVQLGVTPEELQVAGSTIAQFGIADALAELILDDDQGPLITKYLARNITELESIRYMSTAQAAVHLMTRIKPVASALKPKVNPAPDPVESPRQSGSTQRQRGPKGATYE